MKLLSKLSHEARVGIVVLAAIAMFYFGINYLKGRNLFSPARSFYALFDDADGLLTSAPVMVNGLQVGVVDDVDFSDGNSNRVVVKFLVSKRSLRIPSDSRAHIKSDLLGTRLLYLEIGQSTDQASRGDTLAGILDQAFTDKITQTIDPLKTKVESLVASIDSVLVIFRGVFNKKTQDGLITSFESINRSIQRFEHTVNEFALLVTNERSKLGTIFSNIRSITENLKNNNEKLNHIFSNFDRISDDIARSNVQQTMTDLQKSMASLQQVASKMERGEGSIGKLLTDDSLYTNLNNSSRNLDLLLEDLRLHPKRYVHFSVFGKKEKK